MKRMTSLRQSVAVSAVLMAILFVLPLAVIVPFRSELFSSEERAAQSQKDPFVPGELDGETVLKVLDGDEVREMTVGEYLVGVVRAEMPASFEEEALKAQAVAAGHILIIKSRPVEIMEIPRTSARIPPAARPISVRSRPGPTGERMPMKTRARSRRRSGIPTAR